MKNAPNKSPTRADPIYIAQNIELNFPILSSVAHSEIYRPLATHKILAPNPLRAAAMRMTTITKILLT
jgi:hypothetical protein